MGLLHRLTFCTLVVATAFIRPVIAVNAYAGSDASYARSLNGEWSFKYLSREGLNIDAGFTMPDFDTSRWATIPVPANWELKGFAEPAYADALKDGAGLYRRTFDVPENWNGRRIFLRFEGVAFGYEVWVNGRKAGESSASAYNRHTFDVTDFLAGGNATNTLAVRVATRPHGYEFDLNDDWSLSGIYRDVTLFSVPVTHVQDLATATTLLPDGTAEFSVDVAVSKTEGIVRAKLIAPNGKMVSEVTLSKSEATRHQAVLRVARPQLWTAETPSLYRLQLTLSSGGQDVQSIEERVGLRQVSIENQVLLLNGHPIKLRGVNHHDIDPQHGRAITPAQMRTDLELMKKANVNFVRTSHYPPDVRLLELADELGLYVMDEVSIGHGEKNLDNPDYRDNILARVEPTIRRDRNRPSVLIWSIGNENPVNEAELEAGRLAKQLDPSRPITYPKIGSYFYANYKRIPDWVDLYAPHYPTNARLEEYARILQRPTILTEYAHALGLATDRLQEQWETIQQHPVLAGGAVWHFMDQGILRTSATAVDPTKATQSVWLDKHRYFDTHGLDGTDGVMYADRTPQTDYWQMRKVYAPIRFLEQRAQVRPGPQDISVTVENRHDFRALRGIALHWSLQRNGKEVQRGKTALSAPARDTETVRIPVNIPTTSSTDVLALQVRAVDESGLQINERTIVLDQPSGNRATWTAMLPSESAPIISERPEAIKITSSKWELTVQRASGDVTVQDATGRLLVAGIHPHTGRKPLMAEALRAQTSGLWLKPSLTRLIDPAISARSRDGKVVLSVSGTYPLPPDGKATPANEASAAPRPFDDLMPSARADDTAHTAAARQQGITGGYELEIHRNGTITVNYAFTPVSASGLFSEAGLSIVAPPGLDEFRWIGQGPYAGYPGKDMLNEFGIYHLNRADLRFAGNRRGTELAVLGDATGVGFALATAPGDIAVERDGDRTLLSHNAFIGSLGNKGTAPEVAILPEKTPRIAGTFSLVPLSRQWPAPMVRWFGQPAAARDVFKPFFHSYDQ
ncbi:glycoside hydrolase family 2 TIM barrel-domain containing protein [Pseudoduganella lutea]|uniref:Beta-galactosidase n=1 Tax=Pseudoduganella lutea TaxID=321985 RepID=A0A4P6L4L8_9BURK|nr:glycoside hydrolase family 2 TIM barrel-domain containing protein [Pseudoduganella lutea]QBE66394.1 hypothetical protein EWM63_28320 [Pseudoduganella lutea]